MKKMRIFIIGVVLGMFLFLTCHSSEARQFNDITVKRFEYSLMMLKETVQKLVDSNQQLKIYSNQLETSIKRIENEINMVEAELGEGADVDAAVDRVTRSEALVSTIMNQQQKEIDGLSHEISSFQKQLGYLKGEEEKIVNKIEKAKEGLAVVPEPLLEPENLEPAVPSEEKEKFVLLLQQSQENIEKLKKEIAELERQKKKVVSPASKLQSEYDELQVNVQGLEKKYEDLVSEEKNLEKGLDLVKEDGQSSQKDVQRQVVDLKQKKKKLMQTLHEAEEKLAQHSIDLDSDGESISGLQENLNHLEKTQKQLQDEFERLSQR